MSKQDKKDNLDQKDAADKQQDVVEMLQENISVKSFLVHKAGESFSDCHDAFSIGKELNRFAIADGVSKSFFPAWWSPKLTQQFIKTGVKELIIYEDNSDFINTWLDNARNKWRSEVEAEVSKPSMKYFTRNKFNMRESAAATFVGLELGKEYWWGIAIGDSFLFQFDKDWNKKARLSSQKDDHFGNHPDYWDSDAQKGGKGTYDSSKGEFESGDIFLMATDALAEWITKSKPAQLNKLLTLNTNDEFVEFVNEERKANRLEDDDTTLLVINTKTSAEKSDIPQFLHSSDLIDSYTTPKESEVKGSNAVEKEASNEATSKDLDKTTSSKVVEKIVRGEGKKLITNTKTHEKQTELKLSEDEKQLIDLMKNMKDLVEKMPQLGVNVNEAIINEWGVLRSALKNKGLKLDNT